MSDLTRYNELPEMNKQEAEEYDQKICATINEWAIRTFVFKIRKGYKALGFNSFDDWCESRTTMTRRTVDNWMMRVSVVLQGNCFDLSDTAKVENVFHFSGQLLPFETSQVLYSLPPEKFVEAWSLLYQGGAANLPPKQQLEAINRWRNRTGQIEPPSPPKPKFYCIECGGERVANEGDMCENCKKADFKILHPVEAEPLPNTVNVGPWCAKCGEPIQAGTGVFCSDCKAQIEEGRQVQIDLTEEEKEATSSPTAPPRPIIIGGGTQVVKSKILLQVCSAEHHPEEFYWQIDAKDSVGQQFTFKLHQRMMDLAPKV